LRRRPIWFGGTDRSEASLALFFQELGPKKCRGIYLAVMDMWKPFRNATKQHVPDVGILFDKFHVMGHLGEALDQVRKSEYARLTGKDRRFIKGQKYTLLSNHAHHRVPAQERQFGHVAHRHHPAQTIHETAQRLGVVRVRRTKGGAISKMY
jgi:transposase